MRPKVSRIAAAQPKAVPVVFPMLRLGCRYYEFEFASVDRLTVEAVQSTNQSPPKHLISDDDGENEET